MAICSFAITFKEKHILLVKLGSIYEFADHWSFPGGVVEADQTLQESAQREVLEETGISVDIGNHVTTFTSKKNHITIFLAEYIAGEIVAQESEISEAAWFPIDHALQLPLAYNVRDILLDIRERDIEAT